MEGAKDDDPFSWDVETTVQELCSQDRPWLPRVLSKRPDPVSLSKALNDHEVDGETLLTYEDVFKSTDGLLHDLGLKKMVHKMTIMKAIKHLKSKSPQYHKWKARYLREPDFESIDGTQDLSDQDEPSTGQGNPKERQEHPSSETQGQALPKQKTPEKISEDIPLIALSLQPTSALTHMQIGDSSVAINEPPQKRRKIAPLLVSATVDSLSRKPIPTAADAVTLPPSPRSSAKEWEHASPSAYLGGGVLRLADIAPRSSLSSNMSRGIPESQRSFSWWRIKRIPPGRRLQAKRAMQRLLRSNDASLNLIMSGGAPFTDRSPSPGSEDGDKVLPAFGDSGDEEDYDSDTLREIEEEETERELVKAGKASNLGFEEVNAVLDDATERIIAIWTESKLQRHVRNANKLWHDARRLGRNEEIKRAMKRVEELNSRIGTLRARILEEKWSNEDQLRRQARCLEGSVEDLQYQSWLVDVLTNREPPKLQSLPRRRSIKLSRLEILSDDDGEVITSESEDDGVSDSGFIVDDGLVTSNAMDLTGDIPLDPRSNTPTNPGVTPQRASEHRMLKRESTEGYAKNRDVVDLTNEHIIIRKPSEYIDLVTPEKARSSRPVEDDLEDLTLSKEDRAIPFNQPQKIGAIEPRVWEANMDKWRLLISVLWGFKKQRRDLIFQHVETMTPDELWSETIGRAIENREQLRVFGSPDSPTRGNVALQLIFTRLFWQVAYCRLPRSSFFKSLSDQTVKDLQVNRAEFTSFCEFLKLEVIPNFPNDATPTTGRSSSRTPKVTFATDGLVDEDGDDDDVGSPSKKRKRPIVLDQAAKDLRDSDRRRVEEQDERRKILRQRLAASTTISRDKSRLIINESKEDDQGLIYVNDEIATRIKDHQIDGVRFMWNQIVVDSAARQGCLLAHTMGLGKTMQIITLLVAITEAATSKDLSIKSQIPKDLRQSKTLVLCPSGLVDNWIDELLMWAPEGILGDLFKIESVTPSDQRTYIIQDWDANGGVLVTGYDMFKRLLDIEAIETILTDSPNIVIADEAHKMKNPNTKLHQASSRFRTQSRIALTGSPLANNVEEYHSMIDWVAPNYLGPLKEFREVYAEPIQVGLWGDSTDYEFRKAKKMLTALEKTVAPKAHRATIKSCLKDDLPPKMEFVLTVPLTDFQIQLYEMYVNSAKRDAAKEDVKQSRIFAVLGVLGLVCNHPRCFQEKLMNEKEKVKKDEAQNVSLSGALVSEGLTLMRRKKDLDAPGLSWKIQLLIGILDESRKLEDKVLVFTQSIPTLNYLEALLRQQQRRVSRLDGSTPITARQGLTKDFNRGNQEVYLISTNAGGVGLNIFGANRVVIFDFKFNPINEQQAVGRAYRIGQTKPVYVYRFVSGGTFEQILQNKAVFKMQLASRVVDKENPRRWSNKKLTDFLTTPEEPEQSDLGPFIGKDPVLDGLLSSQTLAKGIRSIVMTDTFEEEDPNDHVLTAEDRKEVEGIIAMNRLRNTNPEEFHRMEQERLLKLREMQYPAQPLQTFDGASDSVGMASRAIRGTPNSYDPYTLYNTSRGPAVTSPWQQLPQSAQTRPVHDNTQLVNGQVEHGMKPVAGATTYFATQPQPATQFPPASSKSSAPSSQPPRFLAGTHKTASPHHLTGSGAADAARKSFENKLVACLRTQFIRQWGGIGDNDNIAKNIGTSVQHLRDGKSFGFLPDSVHWKTLSRCVENPRFAAAVVFGHLTPVFLALTSEDGLEKRAEELSRLSEPEFHERLLLGLNRPKDPNHLQSALRKSNIRIETKTEQSSRAKDDLKVMREVADRRKHKQRRLPSWAKYAVDEPPLGEVERQSRERSYSSSASRMG